LGVPSRLQSRRLKFGARNQCLRGSDRRGLCIGLNRIDPKKWAGWNGKLKGCLNDASDMKRLLTAQGFAVTTLTDSQATIEAVLKQIETVGGQCKRGTFSSLRILDTAGNYVIRMAMKRTAWTKRGVFLTAI
jgi:hypothetical protein